MTTGRVIFVREANPYGAEPEYALYPLPERASGDRLCRLVLGLRQETYLSPPIERVNLCPTTWSIREARSRATSLRVRLAGEEAEDPIVVLLGAKVLSGFGFDKATIPGCGPAKPFTAWRAPWAEPGHLGRSEPTYVALPHPSGLNQTWNAPGNFARARDLLRAVAPHVPWGEAS